MKKAWLALLAVVVAYACSDTVGGVLEDAGTMLQDAGEQMQDSGTAQAQTFPVECSRAVNGFVLTDVHQREFGEVIIRQTFPDPWGVTDPRRNVDYQSDAFWSIDGKVLVQCSGDVISASIEVR